MNSQQILHLLKVCNDFCTFDCDFHQVVITLIGRCRLQENLITVNMR